MKEVKDIKKLKVKINKILKNMKRSDLDWTIQTSVSSTEPNQLYYSALIASPNQSLQPITWVKKSYEELEEALETSAKVLDDKEVMKAYYKAEIQRAETLIKYYNDKTEALNSDES